MLNDHQSSRNPRRQSPTHRRTNSRRTIDRETVQSDELSSTNGTRMISNDNPFDPSMNPHLSSSSIPVVPEMGGPHPKSPAARAQQRATAAQNRGLLDLPPIDSGSSSFSTHDVTSRLAENGGLSGQIPSTPPTNRTGRNPRVARSHVNPRPNLTGEQAPVAGTHTRPSAGAAHRTGNIPPVHTGETVHYKPRPSTNSTGSIPRSFAIDANAQHSPRRKRTWPRVIAALAIVFVVVFGGYAIFEQIAYAGPIEATVNGEKMTLQGDERSIEGLLDNEIVTVTPGNYIAVDNSVLREGEGDRCTALINEQQVTDLKSHINEGDSVVVSNGGNVMEEFTDSAPTVLPAGYKKEGQWGALHVFLPGQDGEMVTRTGTESGITVDQVTKEKIDERLVYYNANTNGEKVIALTFDDGPWGSTTDQILDILKENGAKATFYTIGDQISEHTDQIKRMSSEGHEIATHTWDHAAGSGRGVSLDLMSTAERQQEVEKGLAVIKEITGKDASIYFRAPGGNFNESTAADLMGLVDGEIGWNVDTEDWRRPGADTIAERIKSVKPGEVILMHDGGGDRTETVAGLRQALAYLKSQGYKFVTISELIEEYPYQGTAS